MLNMNIKQTPGTITLVIPLCKRKKKKQEGFSLFINFSSVINATESTCGLNSKIYSG